MLLERGRYTRAELLAMVRELLPRVEVQHLDAALALVLQDPQFVERPENGGIRWELRPTYLALYSSATSPAAPPGDYINIEAGTPSREAMAAELQAIEESRFTASPETLANVVRDLRAGGLTADGSSYATLGSEILAIVWAGFSEFLTVAEINSRLAGRIFWTPAWVDKALESGFRSGALERVVRGGVVVGYRPIITGDLRPTAWERLVREDEE
jgi:hypothetical protein